MDPSKEYKKHSSNKSSETPWSAEHERKRKKQRAGTTGTSLVHSLLTEKEKVRSWVPGEKEYLEENKGVTDAKQGKIMRGKHKGKPMQTKGLSRVLTNAPKSEKEEREY
jgi:hypothetical protein